MELIKSLSPDVILLDILMPEVDGYEVCRQIKRDPEISSIPVVFLTALKTDPKIRVRALEAGGEGFISKPFEEAELIAQIRAMVKIKEAGDIERNEKERLAMLVADRTAQLEAELQERSRVQQELQAAYAALQERETDLRNLLADLNQEIEIRKLSESSLKETNAYLENLIANANVPIIVWDPSFQITRVNHAAELLIGRLGPDIVGKPVHILFHPKDLESSMALIQTTLQGVRLESAHLNILHLDGSIRSVLWNSSTLYADDGRAPIAIIAQGQDVTDKIRLELENRAAIYQIQQNLGQMAVLNDSIRNPLTILLSHADLIEDEKMADIVIKQITMIDTVVQELDQRWLESEKVLNYLRKYHLIDCTKKPVVFPPSWHISKTPEVSGEIRESPLQEFEGILYSILDCIDCIAYIVDIDTYDIIYLNERGRMTFGNISGQKCYQTVQKDQKGPCPFCLNSELVQSPYPHPRFSRESVNTLNGVLYRCKGMVLKWMDGRRAKVVLLKEVAEKT
jgi:PAS domain S-box-containing protein